MTFDAAPILAAGPGAGDLIEILVGLAVFILWVIASIAGAVKKRRGPSEEPGVAEEPTIVFEPPPMPVPPPPRRKPKPKPARLAPEVPPTPQPAPVAASQVARGDHVPQQPKPRPPSTAALVRRLLRGDVIRGSVAISEVLQLPVSLRPPRDGSSW